MVKNNRFHDVFAFVSASSVGEEAAGIAEVAVGTICESDNKKKIIAIGAYSLNECLKLESSTPIECTPTNRIVLTSQVGVYIIVILISLHVNQIKH